MGRVLAVVAVSVGVLLGAAYLVPRLVDWSQQRQALAERLSAATGRDVALTGKIAVRLLPRPYLAVRGLEIAAPAGDRPLIAAQTAEMRLDPRALLGGKVALESLTLYNARLALNRDRLAGLGALARRLAGATGGTALKIEDSRLRYRAPWLPTLRLDRVSLAAELPADGPAELTGTARWAGQKLRVAAELDAPDASGARRLEAKLALPDGSARARLRGTLAPSGTVEGQLRLAADSLGATLARWPAGQAAAWPATYQAASVRAQARWTGKALRLADLQARLGPAEASGKLALRPPGGAQPPRLAGELRVNRVNLDDLLAAAEAPNDAAQLPGPGAWADGIAGVLPPAPWTGRLALNVGSAIWRERVLRKLAVALPYAGGTLRVATAKAQLPGGTKVSAGGTVTAANARSGERPRAELAIQARSANLRGLLRWAGVPLPGSAGPAVLRRAELDAELTGWAPHWNLANLTASLDGTELRAQGKLATGGARPALDLALQAPALPLDPYLGQRPGRILPPLAQHLDASLAAKLGRTTVAGRELRDLTLNAQLAQGDLVLDKLAFTGPRGLAVTARGEIAGLAGPARRDLRVTAQGDKLATRLAALSGGPDLSAVLGGPGRLTARWQDTEGAPRLRLSGAWAGGAALDFAGRVTGGSRAQPKLAGTLRLRHPRGGAWLRRRAPASLGWLALDAGPLGLTGRVTGTPRAGTWLLDGAALGPARGTGRLAWQTGGARPELSLDLDLARLPLEALLAARTRPAVAVPRPLAAESPWSSQPFDTTGLTALAGEFRVTADRASYAGWRLGETRLAAELAEGRLRWDAAATAGGGRLAASGRLDAGTANDGRPGFALKVAAENVALPAPLPAGPVYRLTEGHVTGELTVSGRGTHPAALARNAQGRIALSARNASLAGLDLAGLRRSLAPGQPAAALARRSAAHLTLPGRQTAIRRLSLKGPIGSEAAAPLALRLAGPAGRLALDGRLDPWAWKLDMAGKLALAGDLPALPLTVTGPLSRPRPTVQAERLAAALRRRVAPRAVPVAPTGPLPAAPSALVPRPRAVPVRLPAHPAVLERHEPAPGKSEGDGNAIERILNQLSGG